MNNLLMWGGLGAAGALLASCWGHVRMFWSQISSRLIVTVHVQDGAVRAVLAYCKAHLKQSRFGPRTYQGWKDFVRPRDRHEMIVAELLGQGLLLLWKGWSPLWITRSSAAGNAERDTSEIIGRPITLTFLRGTFDGERLIIDALNYYNAKVQDTSSCRYFVYHLHGTVGMLTGYPSNGDAPAPVQSGRSGRAESLDDLMGKQLLHWRPEDIGPAVMHGGRALDALALSPDAQSLLNKIRHWRDSREWFLSRSLPWKFGALLYGPPGTGKTAIVRAIAEDLNMPVFSFDLATFRNHELRLAWEQCRSAAPAIALIEDVDGTFVGRKPTTDKIELTFDTLLNSIDGVERTDGLLLFVTTNKIETLDVALGGPTASGKLPSRPGRIDMSVEFAGLEAAGRRQIAGRILQDWPQEQEPIVLAGDGDTGAQFERRCIDRAQELFWKDQDAVNKNSGDSRGNHHPRHAVQNPLQHCPGS